MKHWFYFFAALVSLPSFLDLRLWLFQGSKPDVIKIA